jgi:hypothetical protein
MSQQLSSNEASFSWALAVTDSELPNGEWLTTFPGAKRVRLSRDNEHYSTITVVVGDPHNNAPHARARAAADAVLDALASHHAVQFSPLVFRGSTTPYPPGHEKEGTFTVTNDVQFAWYVKAPAEAVSLEDVATAIHAAESVSLRARALRASLRVALGQMDPTAEFMLLYSVLLLCAGDVQAHVDNVVRRLEPNVVSTRSPKNAAKDETVYTKLRNQVGHVRAGVEPFVTLSEIRSVLPTFRDLVGKAVLEVS